MKISEKLGNMLIKNLFSLFIIFSIIFSIFRLQNLRIKYLHDVVLLSDVIKNELYFNEQYKYLNETTYINFDDFKNRKYKEFNEIFEKYTIDSSYYKLLYRDDAVKISCFVNDN